MPHSNSSRMNRLLKWFFIGGISLVLLFVIGNKFLSSYISGEVKSEFEKAGGTIGDLDVNLFTRSISLNDIDFVEKAGTDSVGSKAQIEKVDVNGIGIYQFLANKVLSVGELVITNGNVLINRAKDAADTLERDNAQALRQILIDRVKFANVNFTVVNDTTREYTGGLNATLTGLRSSREAGLKELKGYTLEGIDLQLDKLSMFTPELYSLEIAKLTMKSKGDELQIDSLQLIPKYSKFNFAEVAGKQTDRINIFIHNIDVSGLKYDHLRDSAFVASKIKISAAEVHSFRDKRQPFRETTVKPLPIAALRDIRFGVQIDTIQIDSSKIEYEEFAPEGFESGTIVFNDLNALLTNVNNNKDSRKSNHAILKASARLMGEGPIDATFELPYDESKPYLAKGTIGKMSLDQLNTPLQNLAFVRVESGTLEGLTFNFSYDDKASTGKLTINYTDLKIEGLKKKKSNVISDLKTLLINTILKNDKDKKVPLEERTGTINFERDRQRQIFNFWWKSLFSGIKSSVINADGIAD